MQQDKNSTPTYDQLQYEEKHHHDEDIFEDSRSHLASASLSTSAALLGPSMSSERRLFRRTVSLDPTGASKDLEASPVGISDTSLKSSLSQGSGQNRRLSVRSRKVSMAEYHEDLKVDLKQGLTRNLLFMSFVILCGNSLLYGYNIGVLNQPTELIKQFYNDTYTARLGSIDEYTMTFLWSLTTALYLPGGMIGAFSAGFLADRLGRKGTVMLGCGPSILGACLSTACVAANSPELLMAGRFIIGLSCGIATAISPMYLMEICPFNLRGAFGTTSQLFGTIGIFLGSLLGLREILGTAELWPYLLLVNLGPALFCLICMPFIPDSPRYLMLIKGDKHAAEKALQFIRQKKDVCMDMEEMETEFQQKAREMASPGAAEGYTMMRLLRTKELRAPLFISVMLLAIQQLSGINAIFFYSTSIFESASVPVMAIQFAVLGTCAINVIMTIVAVPMMDKAGRRPLLLYPMVAMIFILVLIVIALRFQDQQAWLSFVSIGCVFSYVICHAVGLGPIPPMLSGELFRQGPRPMAMSLGGLSNWLFTLVVALSFEMIQKLIKEFTFIIFICLMIAFTIFVYFKVPETKNKTFEEIANSFQKGSTIDVEEMFYENSPNEKENGLHKHDYMSLGLLSQWRSDTPEKA